MAAKLGGADPAMNTRLRLAIQKAKESNVPNDNIKRALEKGAASGEGNDLEEIVFEAYAPHGVALLIETLTDNRNRTVPNLRLALSKYGGTMAAKGAVSYLFVKKGVFVFEPGKSEDVIMEVATEAGAEDLETKEDGSIEVLTAPELFEPVKKAFDKANLKYAHGEITMVPKTTVSLSADQTTSVLTLIEKLEDDEDVQSVSSNLDIPEDLIAQPDE